MLYELLSGPEGLAIDSETGAIRWTPSTEDKGTHSVTVQVSDGRGGSDIQSYTLSVLIDIPNRPPSFVTSPVVDGRVNEDYLYDSEATDPDSDVLNYSLVSGPDGMMVDETTGAITWTPTADQRGIQSVAVKVSDSRGGVAVQEFDILVQQEAGNRAPVIISEAVTELSLSDNSNRIAYSYDVNAIDPDEDVLAYSLIEAPNNMAIDASTGLITWNPVPETRSEFSIGVEDWTGSGGNLVYINDGNSGGFLRLDDTQNTEMSLSAPSKFLGDLSFFKDGILSFDATEFSNRPAGTFSSFGEVTLSSSADSITVDLAPEPDAPIKDIWTTYSIKLSATEWGVSEARWEALLADITSININLESGAQIQESVGFDNFVLAPEYLSNTNEVPVTVGVEDGRGGFDSQSYTIKFTDVIVGEIRGTKFLDLNGDGVWDQEFSAIELFSTPLDPKSTFLRASNNDSPLPPLIVDLASINIVPGDILALQGSGDFAYQSRDPENGISLIGAFSSSSNITDKNSLNRISDAIDAGIDTLSPNTFFSNLSTDIAEDFSITPDGIGGEPIVVEVPEGASFLFVGVNDSLFFDNSDSDDNLAFAISKVVPVSKNQLSGVTVYLDLNNNGFFDADEPRQVTASDNPDTPDIDETGQYRFTGLLPGNYVVREVVPEGYVQTLVD